MALVCDRCEKKVPASHAVVHELEHRVHDVSTGLDILPAPLRADIVKRYCPICGYKLPDHDSSCREEE